MHRCLTVNAVSDESAGTSVLDPVTLRGSSNILKSALIHVAMRVQFVVAAPRTAEAQSQRVNLSPGPNTSTAGCLSLPDAVAAKEGDGGGHRGSALETGK
jgi:hypothetical protein